MTPPTVPFLGYASVEANADLDTLATTSAIASDPIGGLLTESAGVMHYLTPCCGASGKGSATSPSGVCCRACYAPVSSVFGTGWLVTDEAGWASYAEALRPHLAQFTDKTVASVRATAGRTHKPHSRDAGKTASSLRARPACRCSSARSARRRKT